MAQPKDDKLVAIIGSGHAGLSAVINKFLDISAAKGSAAVNVTLFDASDEPKPRSNTLYPLNGKSIESIHPFETAKPPKGFPTFGEYVRDMVGDDPSLKSAQRGTPTYKNVNDYLQFVLDLAIMEVGDKAVLDIDHRPVASAARNKLTFDDGTTLSVQEIVRAKQPPHLGGPNSPKAPAASAQSSKPKHRQRPATPGM